MLTTVETLAVYNNYKYNAPTIQIYRYIVTFRYPCEILVVYIFFYRYFDEVSAPGSCPKNDMKYHEVPCTIIFIISCAANLKKKITRVQYFSF